MFQPGDRVAFRATTSQAGTVVEVVHTSCWDEVKVRWDADDSTTSVRPHALMSIPNPFVPGDLVRTAKGAANLFSWRSDGMLIGHVRMEASTVGLVLWIDTSKDHLYVLVDTRVGYAHYFNFEKVA